MKYIWNIQSVTCFHKFQIDLIKDGNHRLLGDYSNKTQNSPFLVIFYENQLGCYPKLNNILAQCGQLPMDVDYTYHKSKMKEDIDKRIPNKYFNGYGVIDIEDWRPQWQTNFSPAMQKYKQLLMERLRSTNIVDQESDNSSSVEQRAMDLFNEAAKTYFLKTLEFAKEFRPKAYWGFYGFPDCYSDPYYTCTKKTQQLNDELKWLFESVDVYYPSLYILKEDGNLNRPMNRLKETIRIQQNLRIKIPSTKGFSTGYIEKDILPYLRLVVSSSKLSETFELIAKV